jgi:glycosyltransferase involved in cell wall biosynthesis
VGERVDKGAAPTDLVEVSVVIPVYNEAGILGSSLADLCQRLGEHKLRYEVIVAENGSTDDTVAIAEAVAQKRREVSVFSYPEPNYGGALREGIYRARGRFVVCEEIDLCDVDFHLRALKVLRAGDADMVIGSKAMEGANDRRPFKRRFATKVYNGVLRLTLGFRGTDTHGLKAFARKRTLPVAATCVVEHDVFASELVIRAQRQGLRIVEIPLELREKRAPSVRLLRRLPRVLENLLRLMSSIHLSPAPAGPAGDDEEDDPPAPARDRSA